jgi:glycosyltransferase involved in cell wall biosynthesis
MSRIFFDAFELVHGAGKSIGIYNYALNLFRVLPQALSPNDELIVACNPINAKDFHIDSDNGKRGPKITQIITGTGAPTRIERLLWMKWRARRLALKLKVDVYLSPKGFLPGLWGATQGLKTVVTVHDLIPIWYRENQPGYFGWLEERVVIGGLLRTVKHANEVVTHTRTACDDITRHTGRRAGLNYIVSGFPRTQAGAAPIASDYLFTIGSRLPHKNLATVLAAYKIYRQRAQNPLPLLVCGGIDDPVIDGVQVLRGLSDEALHGCYAHAKAVLFLSLAEGFGYPPLEAMTHGAPLICSDLPIFHETTQGAALYVDPLDAEVVACQIENLLKNPSLAQSLRDKGPQVAATYHWDNAAQGIAALIGTSAAKSFGGSITKS